MSLAISASCSHSHQSDQHEGEKDSCLVYGLWQYGPSLVLGCQWIKCPTYERLKHKPQNRSYQSCAAPALTYFFYQPFRRRLWLQLLPLASSASSLSVYRKEVKRGGRVSPRLVARSYLDYQTIINTILCHSFSVQNRLPFLHSQLHKAFCFPCPTFLTRNDIRSALGQFLCVWQ